MLSGDLATSLIAGPPRRRAQQGLQAHVRGPWPPNRIHPLSQAAVSQWVVEEPDVILNSAVSTFVSNASGPEQGALKVSFH